MYINANLSISFQDGDSVSSSPCLKGIEKNATPEALSVVLETWLAEFVELAKIKLARRKQVK